MDKKHYILLICFSLFLVYVMTQKEGFDVSDLVNIQTEQSNGESIVYKIQNENGKELLSTAFTLTDCKHELIHKSKGKQSTKSTGWNLKQITPGIYVFEKVGGGECLYIDSSNEFKSFLSADCKHKTLCGVDLIDGIDENTERTYFRLVKSGVKNKYYIVSVKGDKYLCINDKGVASRKQSSNDCLFSLNQI